VPRRAVWPLLVVLGIVVTACGSETSDGRVTTRAVTSTPDTVATTTTDTSESPAGGDEVETYLVEMSNLAADLHIQLADFECSYNELFSPGECGVEFVEEGEAYEPPPEPTEEERFEYQLGYWVGTFDLYLAHTDVLDAVDPPPGFESAHQGYIDAHTAAFTYLYDQVASSSDLAELEAVLHPLLEPLVEIPLELGEVFGALVESCQSLVDLGTAAGYRSDLGCPSPLPQAISVDVAAGDVWLATPNPLAVGDGLVAMTITNTGTEPVRPVVIEVRAGDPLDLPIIDGVVDISRSGEFDPASGYPEFVVHYAGEGWEVIGEPLELFPGELVEAVIWSEGAIVVFDYRPGEFASGAHVVIERSEVPG